LAKRAEAPKAVLVTTEPEPSPTVTPLIRASLVTVKLVRVKAPTVATGK
jgi:hypothetical protein